MVLSYEWAFFGKNKLEVLLGAIWVGVGISFMSGLAFLLILRYYEYSIPILLWVILSILLFSIATYSLYKSGCNRLKKGK
jgi:Na+-translocating ferredoxin:NAD+ oxidoreductase RnfD subunit